MTGYLGLGSNVGDRRANLQAAVGALGRHGVRVLASSSVYDTDPVGEVLDQPSFLNACVRIDTDLGPEALLDACKAVERELGRDLEGACATGRGRSTSTSSCSATSSTSRRGCASRTPRRPHGGSCSSRCSSWTSTCARRTARG